MKNYLIILLISLFSCTNTAQRSSRQPANFDKNCTKLVQYFSQLIVGKTHRKIITISKTRNQCKLKNCWAHSSLGYFEQYLLVKYKTKINLSTSYLFYWHVLGVFDLITAQITRGTSLSRLIEKVGEDFWQAGNFKRAYELIQSHGIIPDAALPMRPFEDIDNNTAFVAQVQDILFEFDELIERAKKSQNALTANLDRIREEYQKKIHQLMNSYIGEMPTDFLYAGKTYTAKQFSEEFLALANSKLITKSINRNLPRKKIKDRLKYFELVLRSRIQNNQNTYASFHWPIEAVGNHQIKYHPSIINRSVNAATMRSTSISHAVQIVGFNLTQQNNVSSWIIQNTSSSGIENTHFPGIENYATQSMDPEFFNTFIKKISYLDFLNNKK